MRGIAWTATLLSIVLAAACSDDTVIKPAADAGRDGRTNTEAGTPDGPEVCVELLPTSFPEDTVLKKNCYLCKQTPKITDGVKITMEPGVKIVFSADTGLDITDNDILIAAGTATQPIVFTGAQKVRGHWKGLTFGSTLKPDSKLDYVIIEYAGDTTSDKTAAALKASADSRGARFSMTNTIIRESQGFGINLGGSAVVGAFSKNTLTKNTLGPGHIASEVVSVLDAASTYKGNDRDELYVKAWRTKGTWATLDVPYYVDGPLSADGDWTIAAGATLILSDGSGITISDDAIALVAVGTAQKPILFTGATKKRGAWKGIHFNGSNNTRNALAYATVEYAGDTITTSDKDAAAVKLTSDSSGVQLSMTQTKILESQGWGLYAVGSAVLPGFVGNTLTKNTLGPASVASEAVHQLLPTSTYTGNDVDRLMVQGGYVSKSVTWQKLDVPYLVNKHLAPNHAVLTLAPGITLLMADGGYIDVGGDDTGFHAVGTAAAPITITSLKKTAGAWESIVFDNTINGANALDYCTVEYGGGGAYKGWGGMIHASADSSGVKVSIANSKIQNSSVCCVWQSSSAQLNLSGTTFASCASGDVCKQP